MSRHASPVRQVGHRKGEPGDILGHLGALCTRPTSPTKGLHRNAFALLILEGSGPCPERGGLLLYSVYRGGQQHREQGGG